MGSETVTETVAMVVQFCSVYFGNENNQTKRVPQRMPTTFPTANGRSTANLLSKQQRMFLPTIPHLPLSSTTLQAGVRHPTSVPPQPCLGTIRRP